MQPPEKLTIAQANFHMLWGGQAEVVLALGKSLSRRGHRLIVISPRDSELAKRAAEAGLETYTGCRFRKGFRPLSFFGDVAKLGAFLRDNAVRIYHCHGSQDHWVGAFAVSRHSRATRIVRTRHNIYPVKNHAANRWLFQRKTAQVITIFGEQKKYFTESGLLGAEQLETLHSPLPQEFVNTGDVARVVRNELKLPDGAQLVGFAANFHPDKAPLDFVAAAKEIAAAVPSAHFCMAGHGPLEEAVRAEASRVGLEGRFHLLGFRKDILPVMASFDMLVLPSITREASSTVAKQAAALGKPVVATDIGGTREIVEHERTGLLVKPGDVKALAQAVLRLLRDGGLAERMGSAGREKVLREFTSDAIAERTEAIYRRVLGLAGRDARATERLGAKS